MTLQTVLWAGALLILCLALALCVTAIRHSRPRLALFATVPVTIGLAGVAFQSAVPAPTHAVGVTVGIVLALVGIVGGNPITSWALAYAGRGSDIRSVRTGKHGGIVIDDGTDNGTERSEVLRGGTTIGYLERLALIAAILFGRLEIVAVLIAVKGLGRFAELDSPETRERFIIGTLVSLIWAGACALLIVL